MKRLVLVLILVLPLQLHSQNVVRIATSLRNLRPSNLHRIIEVPFYRLDVISVAEQQALNRRIKWQLLNTDKELQVTITRQLTENSLKSTQEIYGPYNYVRTFSKLAKTEQLVDKRYKQNWKHINDVTSYNGAHHIINKYTLKLIYNEMKEKGKKVNLKDMQNNAPAIFHPLHGNPAYKDIFHNPEKQLEDYNKYGMKTAILMILYEINIAAIENNIPPMPFEQIQGILIETEFWCRTYGLVWDREIELEEPSNYHLDIQEIEPVNTMK